MTKLLSLICCLMLSTFVFGQAEVMRTLEEASCSQLDLCTDSEDSEEKFNCVQAAAQSCSLDIDVDQILIALDKKKYVTTGVKSEDWLKHLKSMSDSSKLVIGKSTSGASLSVVNKRTGKIMIRIPLTRVSPTAFASVKGKKFSKKEMG